MDHWHSIAEPPPLGEKDVHVWRWSLDLPVSLRESLWQLLNAEERQRAQRFLFACHHGFFVAGRGLLRTILRRYLGQPPQDLQFGYGRHGKPFLPEDGKLPQLQFNLTHAHELALLAVTRRRQVGIDVEWLGRDCPGETIAEQFFTPGEVAALRAAPAEHRRQAFFTLWTRKEALLKATGKGLAIPLAAVEVLPLAAATNRPLTLGQAPEDAGRWSLRDLDPGGHYRGALVVEGFDWRLWCGNFKGF